MSATSAASATTTAVRRDGDVRGQGRDGRSRGGLGSGRLWRALAMLVAMMAVAAATPVASAGGTCPGDIDGDGQVNGGDLGSLLSAWGPCSPGRPCMADLNGDGQVDGADLGAILSNWGECPQPTLTLFIGIVEQVGVGPISGAVIISDAGGTATSGKGGVFELAVELPKGTASVMLTAVATIGGTNYQGSIEVTDLSIGGVNEVGPITVASEGDGCQQGYGWVPMHGSANPYLSSDAVMDFAVFDDGSGPKLFAGGGFGLAKWDGADWTVFTGPPSPFCCPWEEPDCCSGSNPTGGDCCTPGIGRVTSMVVHGNSLYLGGQLGSYTPSGAYAVARLTGGWLQNLPLQVGQFNFDSSEDEECCIASNFQSDCCGNGYMSEGKVLALEVLEGTSWNGTPVTYLMIGGEFMHTANDNFWPPLFGSAGNVTIIQLDSSCELCMFSPAGLDGPVHALQVFEGRLYAGGTFSSSLARLPAAINQWWQGWQNLGSWWVGTVSSLFAIELDGQASLLVGGRSKVYRWSNGALTQLGDDLDSPPQSLQAVTSLSAFDDGSGMAIYAGTTSSDGSCSSGSPAFIFRWNGTSWGTLGTVEQLETVCSPPQVSAMRGFDDGSGPSLFTGGWFSSVNGEPMQNISKWGCTDP
jgi:hypothetical protein